MIRPPMDLDRGRATKRKHAEWKVKHVDRGDGYCANCRGWAPCVFAQAAGAKEKPRPADAPQYGKHLPADAAEVSGG